jgi:hypothetical protein
MHPPSILPRKSNPVPLAVRKRHEVLRPSRIPRIRYQPERSPVTRRRNDGLDDREVEDTAGSVAGEGQDLLTG